MLRNLEWKAMEDSVQDNIGRMSIVFIKTVEHKVSREGESGELPESCAYSV